MLEVFLLFIEFCISAPQCSDSLEDATIINASHFFNCDTLPPSIYNNGVLTIPSNITLIGSYAFSGTPIKEVVVNSNVENLSPYAFEGCENLISITIEQKIEKDEILGFTLAPNLDKLIIDGTTIVENKNFKVPEDWFDSIPDYYFSGSEFEALSLPSSYGDQENRILGNWAFSNCLNLKKIEIHFQILYIPSGAFYNCPSLTEIIIGEQNFLKDQVVSFSTIDDIGSYAFSNSTSITTVVFSNRDYIVGGRIIESSSLARIKFEAKPIDMQFSDVPPFEGCLNLKYIEFPFENFDCENFETVNFTIFVKGSSLEKFKDWCDPGFGDNESSDLDEDDDSLSAGLIAAIVLGCVALVVALTLTIYCFCSNKKEDEYQSSV